LCDAPRSASRAAAFKARGNALYKQHKWNEAVEQYRDAIAACPREELHHANRAVYYSNCAACFLQLHEYERVVKACDFALESDPRFVKALVRRAKAHEKLENQEAALEDYKKAVEIDPRFPGVMAEYQRLSVEVREKQEKMKEEVLGKLKDLGNMVLGKFGMSLDNFKMEEQPGGGYSINFQQ
jgi:tetratricopeptide (TPR) repeat protein